MSFHSGVLQLSLATFVLLGLPMGCLTLDARDLDVVIVKPSGNPKASYDIRLDGVLIGDSDDVTTAFAKLKPQRGDVVRVTLPDNDDLTNPAYTTPFHLTHFVPTWYLAGVKTKFFYRGKQCDIRLFWWSEDRLRPELKTTEFYLDGTFLGKGATGLEALTEVKWGVYPAIMIVWWNGDRSPYHSLDPGDGPLEWTKYFERNMKTLKFLASKRLRFSDHVGGDAMPLLHPERYTKEQRNALGLE